MRPDRGRGPAREARAPELSDGVPGVAVEEVQLSDIDTERNAVSGADA